jgi:hypothetical protein
VYAILEATMDYRWLIEHDCEGEVYTSSRTDEALIRDTLRLFNGSTTYYCCLSDTTDDSCLWCVGEPERRVIEGRLAGQSPVSHFVLSKRTGVPGAKITVRCGMQPDESVKSEPSEVLTAAEATAVFLEFFRSKSIPNGFEPVPKAYLFG